jgi:hypothetical protein
MWEYIFVTENRSVVEKLSSFVKLLEVEGRENIKEREYFKKPQKIVYNVDYETNINIVLNTYLNLVSKECGVGEQHIKAQNNSPKPSEARYIFCYLISEQFFNWKREVTANFLGKHISINNVARKYIEERTDKKFIHIPSTASLIKKIENIEKSALLSDRLQETIKFIREYELKNYGQYYEKR